jgi:single-stranded DNA-binding protein
MADLNVWVANGRIASDPETKTVGDQQVTEFRFVCDTSRKKDVDEALFITAILWGREGIVPWLAKGKKISGTGALRQREWHTEDGSKRSVIEWVLRDIDPFFANPKAPSDAGATPAPSPGVPETVPMKEEIPFGPSII